MDPVARLAGFIGILIAVAAVGGTAFGAEGVDPRKVSVLYTGDPYPGVTPYLSMKEDAFTEVTPVQASYQHYAGISGADIMKAIRIYMPRTYDEYARKYDVTIISDSSASVFSGGAIAWFGNGVAEYGIGLVMVGGNECFGKGWENTPVEEALPVSFPSYVWVSGYNKIEVLDFTNEFIASLPFKPSPEYMRVGTDGNYFTQKAGSSLLARWITSSPQFDNPPCYVTWTTGKGRSFAMAHDWTPAGGWVMSTWDYYLDYAVNLMLYLADRSMPSDPGVVHQYRRLVHDITIARSTLYSLIDFVESFGGSAGTIDKEIIGMDDMVIDAKESYLSHDWSEALTKIEAAMNRMGEIEELAVKVKNDALFWVYVIEWLSVSGVSLLAGAVLWLLMIRRTLYREVRVTKGQV